MDLLQGLEAFFADVPLRSGDRLVVAFSGGGDSTALLWGLTRQAPRWGIDLLAAHLDHGMDAASGARQAHAAALARRLGVPLFSERREVGWHRRPGESPEAAARRLRYDFLERVRQDARARYVATAHHREDQAETVLLRLAFGSGLRGLAGIRPAAGSILRPLLLLPRAALRAAVDRAGLTPADDPGNRDPRQPRSRMRHHVLPALAAAGPRHGCRPRHASPDRHDLPTADGLGVANSLPAADGLHAAHGLRAADGFPASDADDLDDLVAALARLAERAARACAVLDRRLAAAIDLHPGPPGDAAHAVDIRRLRQLPPPLLPHALALLHRSAGAPYPASRAARGEFLRQLRRPAGPARRASPASPANSPGIGCDCGAGWRWLADGAGMLRLAPPPAAAAEAAAAPAFTYTLEVPGVLTIPEIAVTIRVSEAPVEPWMWRGAPHRAALAMPMPANRAGRASRMAADTPWTVRNRRPGDRLRPLGAPGSRKLKEILIDRGVPRWQRDRLPLLCWAGEIAWVPGVAIDHRFRLSGQSSALLVEIAEIAAASAPPGTGRDFVPPSTY